MTAANPAVIQPPREFSGIMGGLAFSPDGALLATTGAEWGQNRKKRGLVLLFNGQTGPPKGELDGHADLVHALAWSPDGKTLATQSQDSVIILWDVATRTVRHRIGAGRKIPEMRGGMKPEEMIAAFATPRLHLGSWSPDGKALTIREFQLDMKMQPPAWTTAIQLVDSASGQVLKKFASRKSTMHSVVWTPDGTQLAIASFDTSNPREASDTVQFVDAESGTLKRTVAAALDGKTRRVIAVSPDAARALISESVRTESVSGQDGKPVPADTAHLWDLALDKAVWTQRLPRNALHRAQFSADGAAIITADADGSLSLREASTGRVQRSLPGRSCNEPGTIAVSPDLSRIATVDEGSSDVNLWKLNEPVPAARFASQTVVREVHNLRALEWRGDRLIGVSEINDWGDEIRTGKEIRIDFWNRATGEAETRSIPEKQLMSYAALSTDGRLLAAQLGKMTGPASMESTGIGIYDLKELKQLRVINSVASGSGLEWSPDGKLLATVAYAGDITVWDAETGKVITTIKTRAERLAWSPDGKTIASGSHGGDIELFNAATGARLNGWTTEGAIWRLSFSPDSKTLAVAVTAQPDTEFAATHLQLFHVSTGKPGRRFPTRRAIDSIRWTPDGSGVGATSYPNRNRRSNGELRLWDAQTGADRVAIDEACGLGDFAFSADGTQIAAYNWSRLKVWDLK